LTTVPSAWDEATVQAWLLEQGVDDQIISKHFSSTTGSDLLLMNRDQLMKLGISKPVSNHILKSLANQEKKITVKILSDNDDNINNAEIYTFFSQSSLTHFLTIREAPSLIDVSTNVHTSSIELLVAGCIYKIESLREHGLRRSINDVIGYQQNDGNYFAKKVKMFNNIYQLISLIIICRPT